MSAFGTKRTWARLLDPWILASALVKLSSPGAGLFPVGRRRSLAFRKANYGFPQLNCTSVQGGEDGFAKISSRRWMPVRGGALSAKSLAFDGLQLPLQRLPAFLRSGMVHVDVRARRGFRGAVRPNGAL